jgi:hypothetical protein
MMHEKQHLKQFGGDGKCAPGDNDTFPPLKNKKAAECIAYEISLECLLDAKNKCSDENCKNDLQKQIDDVASRIKQFCGGPWPIVW